mmetsp:Transcript_24654/g.34434  ORF Transcript_24654/g.34434 Transcript_24654/m.34434 type:complete len:81 (+) Transcript_24654:445-687(+)
MMFSAKFSILKQLDLVKKKMNLLLSHVPHEAARAPSFFSLVESQTIHYSAFAGAWGKRNGVSACSFESSTSNACELKCFK